jgi:hypothetical protein
MLPGEDIVNHVGKLRPALVREKCLPACNASMTATDDFPRGVLRIPDRPTSAWRGTMPGSRPAAITARQDTATVICRP